jgi:hypothetical protein
MRHPGSTDPDYLFAQALPGVIVFGLILLTDTNRGKVMYTAWVPGGRMNFPLDSAF